MQQTNLFEQNPETDGRDAHHNLYVSPEHGKKLVQLKKIRGKKAISDLRRAAEAEIDRQYRLVKAIGG